MIADLIRLFVLSLGTSLALVPVCRAASTRLGYIAKPREDRWHKRPVALFGGVAIAFTLALNALWSGVARDLPVLLTASMLMFAVGFVDDIVSFKPSTKLVAQIALASVLLFFGYRLNWFESITLDSLLHAGVDRRAHQCLQPARQHGRLCAGIALIVGDVARWSDWPAGRAGGAHSARSRASWPS